MKISAFLCFLSILLLGRNASVSAQGTPVSCSAVTPNDMVSSFAAWDWETPRTDPNYCKIWAIRLTGQANGVSHGAPWEFAQNGKMLRIAFDRDYTRQKGWELLRMNLGGLDPVAIPYVIMYNKYTSMIRTYFFLNNNTYQNGAVITMSHSNVNNGGSTGVMAMSNTLLLAPDKYLNSTSYNDEMISYVAKMSSQTGWVVGEFTATFDPNFSASRYNNNTLEFNIFGTVTSNITLGGSLSFKTDAQEGYALAGKKDMVTNDPSDPTRLKKFLATGKRVLGAVSADDADKFLDKIHEGGLKMASSKDVKLSNTGLSIANATRPKSAGGGLRKTVGTVLGLASNVSAAFGIIGSIVGAIWPAKDASGNTEATEPAFTPTISEGTIQMTGSITTTYPLLGVNVQVPGTAHSGNDRSTQPYYNCPLGLFALKNTPVLNKLPYSYNAGEYSYYYPCGSEYQDGSCQVVSDSRAYIEAMDSYQVQNDVFGAFNKPAGLELISAQVALVGETTGAPYAESRESSIDYSDGGYVRDFYFSYMQRQFNAGILEITKEGGPGEPTTYQTPFISLNCFKNLAFTVPRGTKVYVRVKAELRKQGRGDDSPIIYFVQDYAVQVNTGGVVATNPRYPNGSFVADPPFSNLGAALTADDNLVVDYGTYTFPNLTQALTHLTTQPGAVFGTFVVETLINHPNVAAPTIYAAGTEIALVPGFGVTSGTNFVARGLLFAQLSCTGNQVEVNTATCPYNNLAYRPAAPLAAAPTQAKRAEGFVVYPNPTQGRITVETEVLTAGPQVTLTLYDLYGKTIRVIKDVPRGSRTYQLELQGYPTGVYLLKMATATKNFSQKVVVQ